MIRQLTLDDALYVVRRMRPEDRDCIARLVGDFTDESFAVGRFQTDGPAWTVLQDGEPVLIGGLEFATAWIAIAWLVATPAIRLQTWRKVLRFGRTVLANATHPANRLGKRRVEAHVLNGWSQAEAFVARAGMHHEGTRRRAGRFGDDVQMWARVAEKGQQ